MLDKIVQSVFVFQDCEEKQLRWEHREVELERTLQRMENQAQQIAGAASKVSIGLWKKYACLQQGIKLFNWTVLKKNSKTIDSKNLSQANNQKKRFVLDLNRRHISAF